LQASVDSTLPRQICNFTTWGHGFRSSLADRPVRSRPLAIVVPTMSPRRQAVVKLVLLFLGATSPAVLSGCGSKKIPEILRGVSAGGGYWGACPRRVENESSPLAVSPEFNARLASKFPPGTADGALVSGLTAEGFKPAGSCESDPSIRILAFEDKNTIPNVTAQVYWHSDLTGRITWTKGFVAYTFL
jgi:hypothetical protein